MKVTPLGSLVGTFWTREASLGPLGGLLDASGASVDHPKSLKKYWFYKHKDDSMDVRLPLPWYHTKNHLLDFDLIVLPKAQ